MACTDVQTIQAGNGTKTQFSFDFPYIFKSEIHVYFWNAVTKEYDEKLTTDATYPWQITDANPTIVEFTGTAPPSPATPVDPGEPTVDNVKIRRITKVDDIRALFNPGSAIRSDDLNKNFEQLRYAIQEANCAGIPDDVDEYLKNYYWDRYDNTLYDGDTWVSDDTKIATTAALDARFQDEVNDTFTKAELSSASNIMPNNDVAVPTTGALNDYIDEVITNDIGTDGTGITVTDDGDGTITLGLADNTIDFDKIKDADQIKLADQVADPDVVGTDNNIFTAQAATRRFNNYYQNSAPSTTDGVGIGQVWVDPDDDLTLSVWTGSAWSAITSGGTFTNQPKVVYVDASSGDDSNDGHRISRPKKTIKAAVQQINNDATYGDGSIVSVAPGIYAETLPIDITKNDVGIIGQSLRTCIIHPKISAADQAGYSVDVPNSQELQTMFRVNSGSYFKNLTLTGLKASGTRGGTGSLYTDSTYGLPPNQGWNFAFYPNAVIKKSPYIQNCTNFSDSQINNVNFTPHTPGEGAAGDLDSAPCGGGILVDGSVPATTSPLRSIVCDSYTHTALDGPGIFVTNNGYTQCTSSYAFFNHAHITCINGGQANLAASTSDFGRFGLIADGKSPTAIFTSNVDGAAANESTTFNINAPTAGTGWFGDAVRPANNMLVTVNSVTYPVLSATPRTDSEGNAGFTVTISRPDPNDAAKNLGLNGALSDNLAVSFFLRSMIASSGHTMEYVGSGTNYTALPENGGVPVEANQIKELNNGKVWSATTDHKGKFKLGDFFIVDQQEGSISVNDGSFQVNLNTLSVNLNGQAAVGADLDMGANEITSTTGDLKLDASGNINVQTNKIINVVNPTAAQDAATKAYVDSTVAGIDELIEDTTPQLGGNLDVNSFSITSASNGNVVIDPNGTGDILLDANVGIGTNSFSTAGEKLKVAGASSGATSVAGLNGLVVESSTDTGISILTPNSNMGSIAFGDPQNGAIGRIRYSHGSNSFLFQTNGSEKMRINGSGNVGIGTTSPQAQFVIANVTGTTANGIELDPDNSQGGNRLLSYDRTTLQRTAFNLDASEFNYKQAGNVTRVKIDSSGNVGIGTTSPGYKLDVNGSISANNASAQILAHSSDSAAAPGFTWGGQTTGMFLPANGNLGFSTVGTERVRISSSGKVGIGTSSPAGPLHVQNNDNSPGGAIQVWGADTGANLRNVSLLAPETDSGSAPFTFFTNNSWNFRVDATDALTIDSGSRVGIGNNAPSTKLHVSNGTSGFSGSYNARTAAVVEGSNSSGTTLSILGKSSGFSGIFFGNESSETRGQIQYEHSSDSFRFITDGGDETLRLNDGKVGIGTSGPARALHIADSLPVIRLQDFDGTNQFCEFFQAGSGTFIDNRNNTGAGPIAFRQHNGSIMAEAMRINSDGNVGIGTTSPECKLHIRADGNELKSLLNLHNRSTGSSAGSQIAFINGGVDASDNRLAFIRSYKTGSNGNFLTFGTNADGAAPAERMRINSNGYIGIGTNNPQIKLDVGGSSTGGLAGLSNSVAYFGFSQSSNLYSGVVLGAGPNGNTPFVAAALRNDGTALPLTFNTAGTERARVHAGGQFTVGGTDVDPWNNTSGASIVLNATSVRPGLMAASAQNGDILALNRMGTDGNIALLYAQGTAEGSISVSGSTVSYNGGHLSRWSQLSEISQTDKTERPEILRGSVMSNLDELCSWKTVAFDVTVTDENGDETTVGKLLEYAGTADVGDTVEYEYKGNTYTATVGVEDNEQLNKMQVSSVEGDINVAGVFQAWDDDDDTIVNDFYCAMTGDFIIRIAQGTTVARGDLLMSAGDGTAKPQGDDIVRSKTIAKVTSTTVSNTYPDGSYCVPCVLMAC